MKKILIATGGTGGHIYPALVTAQELRRRGCSVVFIGKFGEAAEKIIAAGFPCEEILVKGFVAKSCLDKLKALFLMASAFGVCMGVVRRFKPDAVLGFGGYSSFPTVIAAVMRRIPAMIHEQNAVPGKANRLLACLVRRVATGFKDSVERFPPGKAVWTGNPLRMFDLSFSREQACEELGLDPVRQTVLVFGGSQGSRLLNEEAAAVLAGIDPDRPLQVIHLTGKNDLMKVKELYRAAGVRAFVREYMDRIGVAYAASDLVISRAGAGTVTELGMLGIPAILIPYPGADDHQKYNAHVLERLGTALIIEEKSLRGDILRDKILIQLDKSCPSRVFHAENRERLKNDFFCDGSVRLCDEVLRLTHV